MYQVRDLFTDEVKHASTQIRDVAVALTEPFTYTTRVDGKELSNFERANIDYWMHYHANLDLKG